MKKPKSEHSYYRELPRYNILHLKPKVKFPSIENHDFFVKDVSLAGIQIYSKMRITLNSFHLVEFSLANQKCRLNINQVWIEENFKRDNEMEERIKFLSSEIIYRSGFRLKFHDYQDFKVWTKINQALHNHFSEK